MISDSKHLRCLSQVCCACPLPHCSTVRKTESSLKRLKARQQGGEGGEGGAGVWRGGLLCQCRMMCCRQSGGPARALQTCADCWHQPTAASQCLARSTSVRTLLSCPICSPRHRQDDLSCSCSWTAMALLNHQS